MRLAVLILTLYGSAAGQNGLKEFLQLAPAQTAQVLQLNAALNQTVQSKQQRIGQVNQELQAEYAKTTQDAAALGLRYVELDSLGKEISAAQTATQAKITALLSEPQKLLVQQISAATVQQSLLADASCAYLGDFLPPDAPGVFGFVTSGVNLASFLLGGPGILFPTASFGCGFVFPISIRSYLSLTEAQVSAILAVQQTYQQLNARKQARIADVQVEIREETARTVPDPLALGVRYAELGGIAQELTESDRQARTAAQAVLNSMQKARLQTLNDSHKVAAYSYSAESCHFLSIPAGTQNFTFYTPFGGSTCPENF